MDLFFNWLPMIIAFGGYIALAIRWSQALETTATRLSVRQEELRVTVDKLNMKLENYASITTVLEFFKDKLDDHEGRLRRLEDYCREMENDYK